MASMSQSPIVTPVKSLLGGCILALSMESLARWNGAVLGCSGLIHGSARSKSKGRQLESLAGGVGLFSAGLYAATLCRQEAVSMLPVSWPMVGLGGLLVGVGSKLQNGCTSGHMLSGLSRFSGRSVVATAIFNLTAMITTRQIHSNSLLPPSSTDLALGNQGSRLLASAALPLLLLGLVPIIGPRSAQLRRNLASLMTSFSFGLGLVLSGLISPTLVSAFLLTPLSPAFNPSLLYLALGALPLLVLFNSAQRGTPWFGGTSTIPAPSWDVDVRLIVGAVVFGIGWGIAGVCPGPAIIDLGLALAHQNWEQVGKLGASLAAMIAGGLIV